MTRFQQGGGINLRDRLEVLKDLSVENLTKMELLVMSGLGGLPGVGGQT